MLIKQTAAMGLGRPAPEEPFDGYAAYPFVMALDNLKSGRHFCDLLALFLDDVVWAVKELNSPLYD